MQLTLFYLLLLLPAAMTIVALVVRWSALARPGLLTVALLEFLWGETASGVAITLAEGATLGADAGLYGAAYLPFQAES